MIPGMKKAHGEHTKPSGAWGAIWYVRADWAHPVWQEYAFFLYDLHEREGDAPVARYDPTATHELLVYAIDPKTPVDFDREPFLEPRQCYALLQPANHGYQFWAADDAAAKERIGALVEDVMKGDLSPDTDFTRMWDERFRDGVSLKASTH